MRLIGTIEFRLHSWWRTTSGQVDGDKLDEVMMRSPEGLPWLPGKTVKGLVRDGATQLVAFGRATSEDIANTFGHDASSLGDPKSSLAARFLTRSGNLRFGSAEMPATWQVWARGEDDEIGAIKDALFDTRAMTAINEFGVAKTSSLRRVQVAVPLQLIAPVWQYDKRDGPECLLSPACRMVKSLGAGRNRGFGRVEMRFVSENAPEAVA